MARPPTTAKARLALFVLVAGFVAIDAIGGAPDSPLVPVFPRGVGAPVWTRRLAGWIGLDRLDRLGLTIVSIVLLVILVAASLLVVREAWLGRVGLQPVAVAAGVALTAIVAGPLLLSRDVYSYAAYGRAFALHGANPYTVAPAAFPGDPFTPAVSRQYLTTPSVYGPAFVLPAAAIARIFAGSVRGTILAFKILSGLGLAAAAALAWAATKAFRPGREVAAVAIVGLNPVLVIHTVGGGHNDTLAVALLLLGLVVAGWWLKAGRPGSNLSPLPFLVTAILTLAVLVKVVLVPPLVIWVWSLGGRDQGARTRTVGLHATVAAALTAILLAPFSSGGASLASLRSLSALEGWASGPGLMVRGARALGRSIGGLHTPGALGKATAAVFLGMFAVLLLQWLARARLGASAPMWATSLLLLALSVPYLPPWYAAWFLPFAALLEDGLLCGAALGAAALLALTGVPAEPGSDPALWRDMLTGVHFGAAAVMLAIFCFVVVRAARADHGSSTGGATTTSRSAKARA